MCSKQGSMSLLWENNLTWSSWLKKRTWPDHDKKGFASCFAASHVKWLERQHGDVSSLEEA